MEVIQKILEYISNIVIQEKEKMKISILGKFVLVSILVIWCFSVAGCQQANTSPSPTEDSTLTQNGNVETDKVISEETIKIGVITEITGAQAVAGKAAQESINQYVREVNAAGGLLGKTLEVVFEDDQSTQTTAVNAFNKLVLQDKVVAVLGPLYSTHCLAIKPRAEELEFPWLAMGLANRIGEEDSPKWTFQGRATDSITPTLVLNFIEEQGKSNPAIIYINDDFGIDGKDKFIPLIEARGWEVATAQALQSGDKEFTSQILSVKTSGADSIILWLHQEEAGLMLRQLAEQGVDNQEILVVGQSSLLGAGVTDIAGDSAVGTFMISGTAPLIQNPEWSQKFANEYGENPDFLAADSLDGFATIVRAIELAGKTDPESIRLGFLSIKEWIGPFGFPHTFGTEDAPQQGVFSSIIVKYDENLQTEFVSQVRK